MRRDAQEHRAELVAAASRVFAKHGFNIALQAVLDEAGLARGTLYRYFPGREDLVLAVLDAQLSEAEEFVANGIDEPDLLRRFIVMRSEMGARHLPVIQAMQSERLDSFLPGYVNKARQVLGTVVAVAIRRGDVASDFSIEDLSVALVMMSALHATDWGPPTDMFERGLHLVLSGARAAK